MNATDPSGLFACHVAAAKKVADKGMNMSGRNFETDFKHPIPWLKQDKNLQPPNPYGGPTGVNPFGNHRQSGPVNVSQQFYGPLPSKDDPKFTTEKLLETVVHEYGHRMKWETSPTHDRGIDDAYRIRVKDIVDPLRAEYRNELKISKCGE